VRKKTVTIVLDLLIEKVAIQWRKYVKKINQHQRLIPKIKTKKMVKLRVSL